MHATPLSETALVPTIQNREERTSKEEKERNKDGGERTGRKGRNGEWEDERGAGRKEGRDSPLKCIIVDL